MRRRALSSASVARLSAVSIFLLCSTAARGVAAEEGVPDAPQRSEADGLARLSGPPRGYARVVMTLAFGDGVRLNNPYRLQTQLGATAESPSLTAPYMDIGAAVGLGAPDGLQHGAALRLSHALSGVSQDVLTPSYFAAYRGSRRVLGFGRIGTPIVLSPDASVGAEIGAGLGYFLTGKIGVFGEVVGDLFYGAGTFDVKYGVYPVVSAQLGLIIDAEILP